MDAPDSRPILVPVDFSASSAAALLWGAALARAITKPLVVLHVVHDPVGAPGYYLRAQHGGALEMQRIEEGARDMMDEFLRELCERHPEMGAPADLTTRLVAGVPATRILEVADELDARLIVMGSEGRTGLARALLGSKAERVVRLAPVPVTIVKAPPLDDDA